LTKEKTQFIFVDTPGFHKEKSALSKHMLKSARSSVAGVDVIVYIVDCSKLSPAKKPFIEKEVLNESTDVILLLNKVDLVKDKPALIGIIEAFTKLRDFTEIIPISVKNGTNVEKILPLLEKYAKESECGFYFDPALPTDQPEKIWLSEIIREKLLNELYQELPHGIAVQIETLEHTKTNKNEEIVDLRAAVICEKDSHKGMIIGKQGAMLKKIGEVSRLELEEYFECKVNLKLWVKIAEDWRNRENLINQFGLKQE
jgi:GTP-binding protein Era